MTIEFTSGYQWWYGYYTQGELCRSDGDAQNTKLVPLEDEMNTGKSLIYLSPIHMLIHDVGGEGLGEAGRQTISL
jgi:hypothetical protein